MDSEEAKSKEDAQKELATADALSHEDFFLDQPIARSQLKHRNTMKEPLTNSLIQTSKSYSAPNPL